jgi:hypothetical protein
MNWLRKTSASIRAIRGKNYQICLAAIVFTATPSQLDDFVGLDQGSCMPNKQTLPDKSERPTKGAQIGARLRARANTLSAEARETARLRGMQLIYGNASGNKVHTSSR